MTTEELSGPPTEPIRPGNEKQSSTPYQIGPYRILETLGEGGMGEVFKVERREPVRQLLALKVIKQGLATKEVLARFELERRALAAMSHRSIAKVFDAGCTERGEPYFVMELVEGLSLMAYCDKHKLCLEERLRLFQGVCHAVQHAHQKGIIHRDLKPGNVMVVREGDEAVAKVLDFGLAKATNRDFLSATLVTEQDRIMGTPEYMAPEQAAGDGEVIDVRADVYSLGVLLYELLTGQLPFPTEELRRAGALEALRIIREQEPPKPSTRFSAQRDLAADTAAKRGIRPERLSRELRGDLDWVVLKAMAKEPARRYDAAVTLAADIDRYLAHEPVSAGPPSAVYQLRKLLRRYRGQFLAAAAVFLTAICGAGLALGYAAEASAQAEIAAGNAAHADHQRRVAHARAKELAARAEELEQVAAFQSAHLLRLDPAAMGESIREEVLAWMAGIPNGRDQGPSSGRGALPDVLRLPDATFTNLARQVLASQVLEPIPAAIDDEFEGSPAVQAELLHALARTYRSLGMVEQAIPHARRAQEIRQDVLGADHEKTLSSYHELGALYRMHNDLERAVEVLRVAAEGRARTHGPDHELTRHSRNSLGVALWDLQRLDEAEPHLRFVYENRDKDSPSGQCQYAANWGKFLLERGRAEEAERLLRETFRLATRELGELDKTTLRCLESLAKALFFAGGRMDEGLALQRDCVERLRATLGDEHRETVSGIICLSTMLGTQGDHEEVVRWLMPLADSLRPDFVDNARDGLVRLGLSLTESGRITEARTIALALLSLPAQKNRAVLVPELVGNVAAGLRKKNADGEAVALLEECHDTLARQLGPDHEATLEARALLGLHHLFQDRPEVGVDHLSNALEGALEIALSAPRSESGGTSETSWVFDSLLILAIEHAKRGEADAAESTYAELVSVSEALLGEVHPKTLDARLRLASHLEAQHRDTDADRLFEDVCNRSRTASPDARRRVVQGLIERVRINLESGALESAESKLAWGMDLCHDGPTDDASTLVKALANVGTLYLQKGRPSRAGASYEQAMELARSFPGIEHEAVVHAFTCLGYFRHSQDRPDEAEELLRRAHEISSQSLDKHNPRRLDATNLLGWFYWTQDRHREAEPFFRAALAGRRAAFGNDHPDTLVTLDNLAINLKAQGRHGEAEPLLQQKHALVQRKFGTEHTETRKAVHALIQLYDAWHAADPEGGHDTEAAEWRKRR